MSESDHVACVVLGRERPNHEWELITNTLRRSVAFRSAHFIQDQERALGRRSYQAGVQLRSDYDSGNRHFLKPPEGFEALLREEATEVYVEPPPLPSTTSQTAEAGPLIEAPAAVPSTKMILTEPEL